MKIFAAVLATTLLFCTTAAKAQDASGPLTEDEARSIGVNAYIYLYPLVTMEITRRQLTNAPPGHGIGGPPNTFDNVAEYPRAEDKAVVRPNFDTATTTLETRHRRAAGSRRQSPARCDLSAEPHRRQWPSARWRQQVRAALRQGDDSACRRVLVDHAL